MQSRRPCVRQRAPAPPFCGLRSRVQWPVLLALRERGPVPARQRHASPVVCNCRDRQAARRVAPGSSLRQPGRRYNSRPYGTGGSWLFSPHHVRCYIRIRDHALVHVPDRLTDNRHAFPRLGLAQCQRRSEFEDVTSKSNVEEGCAELVGAVNDLRGCFDGYWFPRLPVLDELDTDREPAATNITHHLVILRESAQFTHEHLANLG